MFMYGELPSHATAATAALREALRSPRLVQTAPVPEGLPDGRLGTERKPSAVP